MAVAVRPPTHRPRSCFKANGLPKACYPDLRTARRVANRARPEGLVAYTCGTCLQVHLGHRRRGGL